MDAKDGPYKIVVKPSYAPEMPTYSIGVEQRSGVIKILVPDAGEGQMARDLCNLLNNQHRDVVASLEATDEQAAGTDGAGLPDPDLGDDPARD